MKAGGFRHFSSGMADAEQTQRKFVEAYKELKKNKDPDNPICFMNATPPRPNSLETEIWHAVGITCGVALIVI